MNKLTTKEFIKRAKEVHGDNYEYFKTEYINARTKVCIICPEHGEFWQRPADHLNGCGCFKCRKSKEHSAHATKHPKVNKLLFVPEYLFKPPTFIHSVPV